MTTPTPKTLPRTLAALVTAALCLVAAPTVTGDDATPPRPLRALLITGGCCHDYAAQKLILSNGIGARARVEWTIVHEGGDTRNHKVSLYAKPDWADGYDVVVHNECFGEVADRALIE